MPQSRLVVQLSKDNFKEQLLKLYFEKNSEFRIIFHKKDYIFVKKKFDEIIMTHGILTSKFEYKTHENKDSEGLFLIENVSK